MNEQLSTLQIDFWAIINTSFANLIKYSLVESGSKTLYNNQPTGVLNTAELKFFRDRTEDLDAKSPVPTLP